MNIYTISFFGHRDFYEHHKCENKLILIIKDLINTKEYVEFLIGRNGEFDTFISSIIREIKNSTWDKNSALTLVLPYATSEYINNKESFDKYYDEVEICRSSSTAHYKSAIQIRNKEMVNRSDLIIFYVEQNYGGAYQTLEYAKKLNKNFINLATKECYQTRHF